MFPSCTHRESSASFAASRVKTQAKKFGQKKFSEVGQEFIGNSSPRITVNS